MNKNKLSRFLLSASAGILTLGISETVALSAQEQATIDQIFQNQADIRAAQAQYVDEMLSHEGITDAAKRQELAQKWVNSSHGYAALLEAALNGTANHLFANIVDVLVSGEDLTAEHFSTVMTQLADINTLQLLGVSDVRDLNSPELERRVAPANVTTLDDAIYFANQREVSGEYIAAAEFFLKARDLTTDAAKKVEYAEKSLLMYSEHFIHNVARSSSLTIDTVTDAEKLFEKISTEAGNVRTELAYTRAANCASDLSTAISDLIIVEKAKLAVLAQTATAEIAASKAEIVKLYNRFYAADLNAAAMLDAAANAAGSVNGTAAGAAKNKLLAKAAGIRSAAISKLYDQIEYLPSADTDAIAAAKTKIQDTANALQSEMYTSLANSDAISPDDKLPMHAAKSEILVAKLHAVQTALKTAEADTAIHTSLSDAYTAIKTAITDNKDQAATQYASMSTINQHSAAYHLATVRKSVLESMFADVVDNTVESTIATKVTDLYNAVVGDASGSLYLVTGLDTALHAAVSDDVVAIIRKSRIEVQKIAAAEQALLARAYAHLLNVSTEYFVTRLEAFLVAARKADNKQAWEAGFDAAKVVLEVTAVDEAADNGHRLAKVLALTIQSEAALRRNTEASDILVAGIDATTKELSSGYLHAAKEVAGLIESDAAVSAQAYDHLRKAVATAVELHNNTAVKQTLRSVWSSVEGLFAANTTDAAAAAVAYENIHKAKTDWAAEKAKELDTVSTADDFETVRTFVADAYDAAAAAETKRLAAMLRAAGLSTAMSALGTTNAIVTALATTANVYVNEDVLTSLYRRALSLKSMAETLKKQRTFGETIVATGNYAHPISLAIGDTSSSALGAALELVTKAYADAQLTVEQRKVVTDAFRKVMAEWMPVAIKTMDLNTEAGEAQGYRTAILNVLVTVEDGEVNGGLAEFVKGLTETADFVLYRDKAVAFETIAHALAALATTDEKLISEQNALFAATAAVIDAARELPFEVINPADPELDTTDPDTPTGRIVDIIEFLQDLSDYAETLGAASYVATRKDLDHTETQYVADRSGHIESFAQLLNLEKAQIYANQVFNSTTLAAGEPVATNTHKGDVAHYLGRILEGHAKIEAMRAVNYGTAARKAIAEESYSNAIAVYKREIGYILKSTAEDRNAKLLAAYQNLSLAYNAASQISSKAELVKEHYAADVDYARILFRSGDSAGSMKVLKALQGKGTASTALGDVYQEIAFQYQAEGKYLETAETYKLSALNFVELNNVEGAFASAESALVAAKECGHKDAYLDAAESFTAIANKETFHGRIRAEAAQSAAEAYIGAASYELASQSYNLSGARWSAVGDHMQAGNQYEKSAWALSKISDITVAQRVALIQSIGNAAHQLQIMGATDRLEHMVTLAETHYAVVHKSTNVQERVSGMLAVATALYEKALAFQKEGDTSHAVSAETKIVKVLREIDAGAAAASIHEKLADLYIAQDKFSSAKDAYLKAAADYADDSDPDAPPTAELYLASVKAYRKAADAALQAGSASDVRDTILPAALEISQANTDQFAIRLEVVAIYADLADFYPDQLATALSEIAAIKTAIADKQLVDSVISSRVASFEMQLLQRQMLAAKNDTDRMTLLDKAKASFDSVKGMVGADDTKDVEVAGYIVASANKLVNAFVTSKVFHDAETGLAHLDSLKGVIESAEAIVARAYTKALAVKGQFDKVLASARSLASAMEVFTRGMLSYANVANDLLRTDDINYIKTLPNRMVKVVETAMRSNLFGLLKSREEAKIMHEDFVAVMSLTNKVNSYVLALRQSSLIKDAHGDNSITVKTDTANTIKTVTSTVATAAAASKVLAPVERAKVTDQIVSDTTEGAVSAVVAGLQSQAQAVAKASAKSLSAADLSNSAQEITHAIAGDGKSGGLAQALTEGQSGPATAASTVTAGRS